MIFPYVYFSLFIKKRITALIKKKLIKPDRSKYMKRELIHGINMDPMELTPRQRLNPMLLTLLGYTSRV